jgi:BMFP domain-containing protein YqiC
MTNNAKLWKEVKDDVLESIDRGEIPGYAKIDTLKKMIEDYFKTQYNGARSFSDLIERQTFKENIEQLLTRDKILLARLNQLEALEKQYRQDAMKAYHNAYAEASKRIEEEMTKEKALQVLGGMSLHDIIDFVRNQDEH